MADRVYAPVDPVQSSRTHATCDRALVQTRDLELRVRHHAVLSRGHPRNGQIACDDLFSHTENKSSGPSDSPPGLGRAGGFCGLRDPYGVD
jgi:hypothetical protein